MSAKRSLPLLELSPSWRRLEGRPRADVLCFVCPCCEKTHSIMVPTEAPSIYENGCVWKRDRLSYDKLNITPSINCDVPLHWPDGTVTQSDCKFHGWIRNGQVEW